MPAISLVDLDGTLADHDSALKIGLDKLYSPNETRYELYDRNIPAYMEARKDLVRHQPRWWFKLRPIEQNFKILNIMRDIGFCLHILTKGPSSKSLAWAEKVEWVRIHIPDAQITITEDKGLVYGRVLFDDYPPYAERWLKWRTKGIVIMPLTEYNKDFVHPNVTKFDGKNFDEVTDALKWAYNRKSE